ncbi:hypothetical protein SBA4_2970016 [Candidatus Sulfopaludibacter sp. SbA4]|nr:hypothetical protein SBA4_2970016 [Candidatus Sulfopaludibacter sp. SbA4]
MAPKEATLGELIAERGGERQKLSERISPDFFIPATGLPRLAFPGWKSPAAENRSG